MKKKLIISMLMAISISCNCAFANQEYLNKDYQVKVLGNINSPQDVKKLTKSQMNLLADDLRFGIINRANTIGGHLGPDLGFVEPTIALHYVFDSPKDKIIFAKIYNLWSNWFKCIPPWQFV